MYAWYAQHPARKAELVERFETLAEAVDAVTMETWEESSIFATDLVINEECNTIALSAHRANHPTKGPVLLVMDGTGDSSLHDLPEFYRMHGFKFDLTVTF